MSETGYVYTLVDPRTDEPKYVGATKNPQKRYSVLVRNPHNDQLSAWIDELDDIGLEPYMNVVRVKPIDELSKTEAQVVEDLSQRNELLNVQLNPNYEGSIPDGEKRVRVECYLELETVRELDEKEMSKSAFIRKAVNNELERETNE